MDIKYSHKIMTSAHLASIPDREELLKIVLASVTPFVDHTFISLNGYKHVPTWLDQFPTVSYKVTDNSLGDAFKFASINESSGLAYILDDDLRYTPEFFYLLQSKVKQYGCPVSLHGKMYERPFVTFKRIQNNYRCLNAVDGDKLDIDIVGTGVLCFDTSMVKLSMQDFPYRNMGDVLFSKACFLQGVKLVVAGHRAGIVQYLHPKETIWGTTKSYALHDSIIKDFLK